MYRLCVHLGLKQRISIKCQLTIELKPEACRGHRCGDFGVRNVNLERIAISSPVNCRSTRVHVQTMCAFGLKTMYHHQTLTDN